MISFSLPFAPGAQAPCPRRAAPLPSLCFLAPKPDKSPQPKPLLEMSFDDRARSPLQVDTPQAASRDPAKTLVMRTCGRSQIAGYRLPRKLTRTVSDATSLWRPP